MGLKRGIEGEPIAWRVRTTMVDGQVRVINVPVVVEPGVPEDIAIGVARAKALHLKAQAERLRVIAPTLEEYLRWWYDERYIHGRLGRQPGAPSTLRHRLVEVDFWCARLGKKPVDEITVFDVQGAILKLVGRRGTTRNFYLTTLRGALSDLVEHGYEGWFLASNVAYRAALSRDQPRRRESLRTHEAIAVLDRAREQGLRSTPALALMLFTGMRLEEARSRKWHQVHFGPDYAPAAGVVWFDFWERKERRPVAIPLPAEILPYLGENRGHGYVVGDPRRPHPDQVRRELREVCRELGIDRDITPHGLRATFAQIAQRCGVDRHTISKALNHSSVEVTDRYYLGLAPPDVREMLSTVGRAMVEAKSAPVSLGVLQ